MRQAKVGTWLSVPGRLNVAEEQHYTVKAAASGRVNLIKSLWDEVKAGESIAELTSPALVSIQEELVTAFNLLEFTQKESKSTNEVLPAVKTRREQAARSFKQKIKSLSVLTGLSEEQLAQKNKEGEPAWLGLSKLSVRAPSDGKIIKLEAVTGDVVDTSATIAEIIDASELIFRGSLPAVDIARIPSSIKARVIPEGFREPIESSAQILPVTDEMTQMALVEIKIRNPQGKLPHGFPAIARLLIKEGTSEEAVVHPDSIVLDGLEHILFKRDSEKPDYVIRTLVELGNRSEDEIEILFGLMEGDQVVRDGVQQLKQTGLGKAPAGGHFHADGTWHEGDK